MCSRSNDLSFISVAITTTLTITSFVVLSHYLPTFVSGSNQQTSQESLGRDWEGTAESSNLTMWRDAGGHLNGGDEDMVMEDEHEIDDEDEINRQRDLLYGIVIPTTSPHGVPSLPKSLDAAILLLRLAKSIDKRLQDNPKIDDFFDYLTTIEKDSTRIARQGFGHLKVVVVEGLLSSGKSTLINGLKIVTKGTAFEGVPANLLEVKYLFHSAEVPEAIVAALDFVINYCRVYKVIADCQSEPEGTYVHAHLTYLHICRIDSTRK